MGRTSYGCQVGTGCSGGPEMIPVGKMKAFFTMEVAWNKDFQTLSYGTQGVMSSAGAAWGGGFVCARGRA